MKKIIVTFSVLFLVSGCGLKDPEELTQESAFSKETEALERLRAGESKQYEFDVAANSMHKVTLKVQACSSKPCCVLEVAEENASDEDLNRWYVSSDEWNTAQVLVDSDADKTFITTVTALKQCNFFPPELSEEINESDTQVDIQTKGQTVLGEVKYHTGLNVTKFEDEYFLRDSSRRGVDGLDSEAVIQTMRFLRNPADYTNFSFRDHYAARADLLSTQAVDAHAGSQITYDYLKNTLGIKSFDNKGSSMIAVTHLDYPIEPIEICGTEYPPGSLFNAFWNGAFIAFTGPVGGFPVSLSAAVDVTAHEWGHAITEYHSNLRYERESGAINEAFSDWIGVAVNQSTGSDSWVIGEGANFVIRSMIDPTIFLQPDTYGGDFWYPTEEGSCDDVDLCTDYCGVHGNSGVANKMFYLLSEGGTHNDVEVQGIGIDTAIKVAFDANANYWTENSDFADAALGMVLAAESYGPNVVQQVKQAWLAVGVNFPES